MASIVCFHRRDFARADEHIQRAIELQPNDATHRYHLAWMRYKSGALDKMVVQRGWSLSRINGSHHIFVMPGHRERLVIPIHGNQPLKLGLWRSLMKLAGLESRICEAETAGLCKLRTQWKALLKLSPASRSRRDCGLPPAG